MQQRTVTGLSWSRLGRFSLWMVLIGGVGIAVVAEAAPVAELLDRLRGRRTLTYTDVRIGDPKVSYKDQEFLVDARLMVWQDGGERIWVSRFDPVTGDLDPPDGRGRFFGVGAPLLTPDVFLQTVINGPEFGFSRRGLGIYYCAGPEPSKYEVVRADFHDGTIETLAPGLTNGVRGVLPTQDWTLPNCRILYGKRVSQPGGSGQVIAEWFDEGDPLNVATFPKSVNGSTGPHWVPHQRAIITNVFDAEGIPQIAVFDIDERTTKYLTAGKGSKIDAIAFEAPEYPRELIFVCTVDDQQVVVYRRGVTMWRPIRRIRPPGAFRADKPPTVSSAEPVIYRGETFFTYVASYADGSSRICLASLDGRLNEWVSPPGSLRQLDPEGVAVGDRLFVYYWTTRNADGVNELHRSQVTISK